MHYIEKGAQAYRAMVTPMVEGSQESNEIHDWMMALKPHHILTINYKQRLEKAAVKSGRNDRIWRKR